MAAPLVSILIPVYNREQLIVNSIQSALEQTVTDLEIVVVDNASTDQTWEVCQKFAKQDSRVRVFRNATNIGPVPNWQRCFTEAKGKYGKVLFSDDLIAPNFLEQTLPYLSDPNVGFVFTAVKMGEIPEEGLICYSWEKIPNIVPSYAYIAACFFGPNLPLSPACSLFRLEDLKKHLIINFESPAINELAHRGIGPDLLLYLLTAWNYPKVAHLSEPLAFFRVHKTSISLSNPYEELMTGYDQIKLWFCSKYLDSNVLKNLQAHLWVEALRRKQGLSTLSFYQGYGEDGTSWSLSNLTSVLFYRFRKKLNHDIASQLNNAKLFLQM